MTHTRRAFRRTLVLLSALSLASAQSPTSVHGYAPHQPIAFSHVVHVSDDKLSCDLCHSAARRSAVAGIAPVERCIGCHRVVSIDNPEIQKVRRYWDNKEPIPWVRVNVLPRFVHFSHEAHVRSHVACDTCHGDVSRMDRIARVVEPTMGWCVGCHRAQAAPIDCLTCHY